MKTTNYRFHIIARLFVCLLFALAVTWACSTRSAKEAALPPAPPEVPKVIASGLGNSYGIGISNEGHLFATGTHEGKNVVWQIMKDSTPQVYTILRDNIDAMGELGIAAHAQKLANLAVDSENQIIVTSTVHGACFLVTPEARMYKVYLNKQYSMSVQDIGVHTGVAWDPATNILFLVTSGPESRHSTKNAHHIAQLKDASAGYKNSLTSESDNRLLRFVDNKGTRIKEESVGLVISPDSTLYILGPHDLYILNQAGKPEKVARPDSSWTFYGGTMPGESLFLSVETEGRGGEILKLDAAGTFTSVYDKIEHPRGMTHDDNYLYIIDGGKGEIIKMPVP